MPNFGGFHQGGGYFWPIPYPGGEWVSQKENHENPKSTQGTFGQIFNMIFSYFWLKYSLLGQFDTQHTSTLVSNSKMIVYRLE